MKFFVFGNPDVEIDALPIKILPNLRQEFPEQEFQFLDPNEEWDVPENLVVIDTCIGIDRVRVFEDLDLFSTAPRISMHGFDALHNLRFLKKLGKLKHIKIIGIPPTISIDNALAQVTEAIKSSLLSKSGSRS